MNIQIIIGLILTVLPISELRGGLPVIVKYSLQNGVPIWPYFVLVLILNILVIFAIFFFFDFLHSYFMKFRHYRKVIGRELKSKRKKINQTKERMKHLGYFALMLFVAVPLPGTGAWTGTFIAWALGLDRIKSFIAIALGVIIAGFLVLFASLGFFKVY